LIKILLLGENPVPGPAGGLVSNYNYFFDDGGTVLTGVSVTVVFTADFISSSNGFSFQLNCYSQESDNPSQATWQQYVIAAGPNSTQLIAAIDNWTGSNGVGYVNTTQELIRPVVNLANLPSTAIQGGSTTIKAGYQLKFILNTDSKNNNNVTGATFSVIDETGNSLGVQTIDIVGSNYCPCSPLPPPQPQLQATSANLAPIVAFTFNIGGDWGGSRATLGPSGAGTVTYAASNPLTIVNAEPSYTFFDDGTGESANLSFGELPSWQQGNKIITQNFSWAYITGATASRHGHALPWTPRDFT
jgi:hypothetical protein